MTQPSTTRWPRLTSMPLALEITLVLLIKVALLFLLWKAFFSQPQAKKMLVPMPQMEQHLLSISAAAQNTTATPTPTPNLATRSPSPLTAEEKHGSN